MACNLVSNVKSALKNQNVTYVTGWTDNTVVLYWLNGQESYNQFIRNMVNKILERDDINWQYVSTRDNPADLGSRKGLQTKVPEIWWKGPSWLQVKENWQPNIKPSEESEKISKIKISKEHKSIVITTAAIQDDFDLILQIFYLHKALRISAWILRFINSCRKTKKSGPPTTAELVNQKKFYIKREQEKVVSSDRFEDNKKILNLEKYDEGVYICKGRLQGVYPICLTQDSVLSKKVIFTEHKRSLIGE